MGHVCSDAEWALSSLPIRLGGAGITSPSTVCAAAALSSWLSACSDAPPGLPILAPDGLASCVTHLATVAPALGIPLRDATSGSADPVQALRRHALLPQWRDQSAWSEELFKVRAASFDSAVSERLMGLRRAQSSSGAGLWLTAPIMGGPAFSAVEWQLLLRLRSGAPCFPTSASCNGCGSQMDAMGDHALCCAHNGMYRRHNHIRDTLFHLSASAHWNPALEQALPGTTTRPADILLRGLSVKPVAVDVTVTHPLRLSASVAVRVGTVSAAAESERHKVSVNKVACAAAGWDGLPALRRGRVGRLGAIRAQPLPKAGKTPGNAGWGLHILYRPVRGPTHQSGARQRERGNAERRVPGAAGAALRLKTHLAFYARPTVGTPRAF